MPVAETHAPAPTPTTPDAVMRAARAVALAGLLALIVLGLAWELWLAPTGSGTLALKVLPLVLRWPACCGTACTPTAGSACWCGCTSCRRRGARHQRARPGRARWRWPRSALCLLLFAACALHMRWRLRNATRARRSMTAAACSTRCAAPSAPAHVLHGGDLSAWEVDWRKRWRGRALAVVRPGTHRPRWPRVVRACAAHGASHRAAGRQHRPGRRRRARRQRHAGAAEPARA